MTYTICKHRKYRGGDVFDSSVKVNSLDAVLDFVERDRFEGEDYKAIERGEVGHYFADGVEFVYQIVVK
ncbi:hypothetical protein [Sporosarcina sp. E16_8]|uniref:hypothetical protein n=1 Tax=Sporosarcina sp. E16_8 TaxID=2789295 RepID=UPI001A938B9E|nr:hypothetical protein [Sporosarcina sp. E16_8]MBO0586095.1 hypothetical protein [Sporosarcina sp. E16_8]